MSTVTPPRPAAVAEAFPDPPSRPRGVDLRLRALDLTLAGSALVVLSPLLGILLGFLALVFFFQ